MNLVLEATKSNVVKGVLTQTLPEAKYIDKAKMLEEIIFHVYDDSELIQTDWNKPQIAERIEILISNENEACTIHHIIKNYEKNGKVTAAQIRETLSTKVDAFLKLKDDEKNLMRSKINEKWIELISTATAWKTMILFMQQSIVGVKGVKSLHPMLQPDVNNRVSNQDVIFESLLPSILNGNNTWWTSQAAGIVPYVVSETVELDSDGTTEIGTIINPMIVTGKTDESNQKDVHIYANPVKSSELKKVLDFLVGKEVDDPDETSKRSEEEKVIYYLNWMLLAFKTIFNDQKDLASVQKLFLLMKMQYHNKNEFDVRDTFCMSFPRGYRELFSQTILLFQALFKTRFALFEGQKRLGSVLVALIGRSIFYMDREKSDAFERLYGLQVAPEVREKILRNTNLENLAQFVIPHKEKTEGKKDYAITLTPEQCADIKVVSARMADSMALSQERTPRDMLMGILNMQEAKDVLLPIPLTLVFPSYLFEKRKKALELIFPDIGIPSFERDFKFAKHGTLTEGNKEASLNKEEEDLAKVQDGYDADEPPMKRQKRESKSKADGSLKAKGRKRGPRGKKKKEIDEEAAEDADNDDLSAAKNENDDDDSGNTKGKNKEALKVLKERSELDPLASKEQLVEFVLGVRVPNLQDYNCDMEEKYGVEFLNVKSELIDDWKGHGKQPKNKQKQDEIIKKTVLERTPDYKDVTFYLQKNVIRSSALRCGHKENSPTPKVLTCCLSLLTDYGSGNYDTIDTLKQVLQNDGARTNDEQFKFLHFIYNGDDHKTEKFQQEQGYSKKGFIPKVSPVNNEKFEASFFYWCLVRPCYNAAEAYLQNYFKIPVDSNGVRNEKKFAIKSPNMFPSRYALGQMFATVFLELHKELGVFILPCDEFKDTMVDYYQFVTKDFKDWQETGNTKGLLKDDLGKPFTSNIAVFAAFMVICIRDEIVSIRENRNDKKPVAWSKRGRVMNTLTPMCERSEDSSSYTYHKYYYCQAFSELLLWIVDEGSPTGCRNPVGMTFKEFMYLLIFGQHPFKNTKIGGMDEKECNVAAKFVINQVMDKYCDTKKKSYMKFFDRYDKIKTKEVVVDTKRVGVLNKQRVEGWMKLAEEMNSVEAKKYLSNMLENEITHSMDIAARCLSIQQFFCKSPDENGLYPNGDLLENMKSFKHFEKALVSEAFGAATTGKELPTYYRNLSDQLKNNARLMIDHYHKKIFGKEDWYDTEIEKFLDTLAKGTRFDITKIGRMTFREDKKIESDPAQIATAALPPAVLQPPPGALAPSALQPQTSVTSPAAQMPSQASTPGNLAASTNATSPSAPTDGYNSWLMYQQMLQQKEYYAAMHQQMQNQQSQTQGFNPSQFSSPPGQGKNSFLSSASTECPFQAHECYDFCFLNGIGLNMGLPFQSVPRGLYPGMNAFGMSQPLNDGIGELGGGMANPKVESDVLTVDENGTPAPAPGTSDESGTRTSV